MRRHCSRAQPPYSLFFFPSAPFLRHRLVVSRPHGQAASCRTYARLQDSIQRQRREVRACRDAGHLAKGSGADGCLHSDRQHAPPPSRPARCRCLPDCGGRAARAQTDQISDEPQRASHDQLLAGEFWIGCPLASFRHPKRRPIILRRARLWKTCARQRGNEGGIAILAQDAWSL